MASVAFNHVSKQYPGGGQPVIRDLSLAIEDREFMVLVGPSGCGKSTALRMIAGLEEVTGGELSIDGTVVNRVPPKLRDIAMVFQNYALYPHMTCRENLGFALKLRGRPRAEIARRVEEVARALEIEHLLDRKPRALSGGQRQRVAIGRAMVREPKVFLMDEPLSNLDAKLRVSMRAEIKKLHQRLRATFVYVTHDQVEAMTLGSRIAIMKGGDLQQCATPHEVYHAPRNLFVATFIGSPPMNLLRGDLRVEGSQAVVSGPGFTFAVRRRESLKDGPVVLGIRPEFFALASPGEPNQLTSTVEVTEPMGAESYVYLAHEGAPIICRLPGDVAPTPGSKLAVTADPAKLHLFDPATELRLA